MKKILVLLLFLVQTSFAQLYKSEPVTALLGAFDQEVDMVRQSLTNAKTETLNGIAFTTGTLNGRRVVVAETGIGKTNAAMTTAFVLAYFKPERVLFTGIAGGTNPELQPGDLVIADKTAYHDFYYTTFDKRKTHQTRNPITKELNPEYFPGDSVLLKTAVAVAKSQKFESIPQTSRPPSVIIGTVVTGDMFVSSEEKVASLRAEFRADATEMEGAAVAQVCHQQRVPCLVIRSLSDKANSSARTDMLAFVKIAARNSANLVMGIVRALR